MPWAGDGRRALRITTMSAPPQNESFCWHGGKARHFVKCERQTPSSLPFGYVEAPMSCAVACTRYAWAVPATRAAQHCMPLPHAHAGCIGAHVHPACPCPGKRRVGTAGFHQAAAAARMGHTLLTRGEGTCCPRTLCVLLAGRLLGPQQVAAASPRCTALLLQSALMHLY